MKKYLPHLCGLLSAIIWGAWLPVTKYSISHSLTPIDITFLRFSTSFFIAIPYFFRYGITLKQNHFFLKISVLTVGAGFGYSIITSFAFLFTPASYGSITPIGVVFFSTLLGLIVYKKKISIKIASNILLILGGFLLFAKEVNIKFSWDSNILKGISLFLIAGFLFACYNVGLKKWSISPMKCFTLVTFYSFLIFLPFYLWFGITNLFNANPVEIIVQSIYQGILVSFVALLLFSRTSLGLGSTKASLYVVLVPIIGTSLSILFLGDKLSLLIILSMFIMLLGAFIGLVPTKN